MVPLGVSSLVRSKAKQANTANAIMKTAHYDPSQLRADPNWDEASYEAIVQLGCGAMLVDRGTHSPRFQEVLCRTSGRPFVPTLADFCPVSPRIQPTYYRMWKKRHCLSEFVTFEMEQPVAPDVSNSAQVKRRRKPKRRQGGSREGGSREVPPPARDWRAMWQKCVSMQIKQNQADRVYTALNRVASRRQELVRQACKKVKSAIPERPYSKAGPSGPIAQYPTVAEVKSESELQKRKGKKAIAIEECKTHADMQKQKAELIKSQMAERMRALVLGEDIGGS